MEKGPLTLAVIVTIVLSLIATGISVYQTRRLVSVRVPYRSIPLQEENVIDRTTVDALRHIAQARADLHGKTPAKAAQEVAEVVRLVQTIRDNLSSEVVRERIWVARKHLEFEPSGEVLRDLPPILAALESTGMYLPTDKARLHIDKARELLEKDDRSGAGRELALADDRLVSIEAEVPLLKAESTIRQAQDYLGKRKYAEADGALKRAEEFERERR